MEKPLAPVGCFCGCWWSIVGLITLLVGILTLQEAADDPRSELVAEYDRGVSEWLSSGARDFKAKYEQTAGAEYVAPLAFNVTGVIGRHPPALKLVTSGAEAFGTLPDAEPDYKRYNEGALLTSTFPQAHMPGVLEPSMVQVSAGSSAHDLDFFACKVVKGSKCTSRNPKGKCNSKEPQWGSKWKYLLEVHLVVASTEKPSDDNCGLVYQQKTDWYDSEPEAGNRCKQLRTPEAEMSLKVSVRSAKDPWVLAGSITKCIRNFGITAADNMKSGIIWSVVGSIAASIACCSFGICMKYLCELRDGC